MMAILHQAIDYSLLALGLGFVIFFHELGHFLAAKYCDVKVEQFAIGFGPAIMAWRKGIGFRWGTTAPDYNKRVEEHFKKDHQDNRPAKTDPTIDYAAVAAQTIGLGETEYRLNWVPLGGYVKMLGQDDLRPGATAEDPRAFNKKSVGARMIIVSAGVIMNVILAAVGFMILFMIGYPVPPATVGSVVANSPAARAATADGTIVGLHPGDTIVSYDGKEMGGDFSRIPLNVALTHEGTRVPIVVQHVDGTKQTLYATPESADDGKGLRQLGVGQPFELAGPEAFDDETDDAALLAKTDLPDLQALKPGDTITQIDGQSVNPNGNAAIAQLYAALNASDGNPVPLTVRSADGTIRKTTMTPHLAEPFSGINLSFLGMVPRADVLGLLSSSPALGKLKPGDAIVAVDAGTDHLRNPTCQQIHDTLLAAGDKGLNISLTVVDPGQTTPRAIDDITPYRLPGGGGKIGVGIAPLGTDDQHSVVAEVLPNTPAAAAKIPTGATLTAVDGKPVTNWFEIRQAISAAVPGQKMAFTFIPPEPDGKATSVTIALTRDDIDSVREITLEQYLPLHPMVSDLKTHNPFVALGWGVNETRDLILQFYITIQRMLTGDVGINNMMGPVGMAHEGAVVASRGTAWLLWFLCLISANLAVVNFLPIPIVDGGLFTLLILEKIQGKPLSLETQRIVQMVGLVLILGVFLLVTYQDIARMAGY
jgi:regulator of sigma E protease